MSAVTFPDLSVSVARHAGGPFIPRNGVDADMPEEVIFETERRQGRSEVGALLRDVADKLDGDGELTLSSGDDSVTLAVPAELTFEVKAERETDGGPDELSVEFELEWTEGDRTADGALSVE